MAQAKNGVVAESLSSGKRSSFGIHSKITALSDVSIYTDEGEVKLKEVLLKMHETLGGDGKITSKASPDELKSFFEKALPDYDRDRFYVSHMKKVVDWYNCIDEFASFDFEEEEKAEEKAAEEE